MQRRNHTTRPTLPILGRLPIQGGLELKILAWMVRVSVSQYGGPELMIMLRTAASPS